MSAEVFQYPSGVKEDIKSENFNRLGCWFTIVMPFVAMTVFLIKDPKDSYDALAALFATIEIILIVLFMDLFLRHFGKKTVNLAGFEIQHTRERLLNQIDDKKNIVVSIDLNKEYEVISTFNITGSAIYSVYQKDEEKKHNPPLQFSSRIRNKDRLLNDILAPKEEEIAELEK